MQKTWLGCAAQNFVKGRPSGFRPEAIVLHRSGGTVDKIRVQYHDPKAAASTHYIVAKSGSVSQFVEESDTAFHAGVVVNARWPLLKPKVNPNFYTVGIEHEGDSSGALTDEQQEASAALISEIANRWSIPIDPDHVIVHTMIRASKACPGEAFDPGELVRRAQLEAATSSPASVFSLPGAVEILRAANVREGMPFSRARIVKVLTAGSKVNVAGFTLQGERTQGNAAWYETEDGNFFWAGNTNAPQPAPTTAQVPAESAEAPQDEAPQIIAPAAPMAAAFCSTGILTIDKLFQDPNCPPLPANESDRQVIGAIQDLLAGHGYKMPSIFTTAYGVFGESTRTALIDFQGKSGLPADGIVTPETLKKLAATPATDPRATPVHLTLVLGVPLTGMLRVLTLTAMMEGVGKFAAVNPNTDKAGMSFGLIQWAQKPGRLKDILMAFEKAAHDDFVSIFAPADAALAQRLLLHVAKPSGGVDPNTGITTDPAFNLVASPWVERFRQSALHPLFQRVQVTLANEAFLASFQKMQQYAPLIRSQRGVAFMLDVANQFGDGSVVKPAGKPDRGLAGLYRKVFRTNITEPELLSGIAEETVAAMPDNLKVGVRARRDLFLKTTLLTDEPFQLT